MPRLDLAPCDFNGDAFALSDFLRASNRRRAYGYDFTVNAASFRATDLFELPAFRCRKRRENAARIDGYPRRCYRSTRIEILRKRRLDNRRPPRRRAVPATLPMRRRSTGPRLGPLPNMKPAATVQPKSVAESGERPRDISAVFDEHIDVHPARPGESLPVAVLKIPAEVDAARRGHFRQSGNSSLEARRRRPRP